MSHHQAVALAVAIYLAFLAIVAARLWREKRAERRLRWPASLTQRQMEKYGLRYLLRQGWQIALFSSHGSKSLYRCIRKEEGFYALFLRDISFFSRLLRSVRIEPVTMLRRLVIVLLDPPTPQMRQAASESGIALIHYKDLAELDQVRQAMLSRNAAPPAAPPAVPPAAIAAATPVISALQLGRVGS